MDSLLNLQDYSALQLGLYATGAYLWVVAYIIYIRNGFKYQTVEMPAFAACGNIGWEFCWALIFTTNLGSLSRYAHFAWFGLDCVIFYLVLMYAHKQTDLPVLRRYWKPMCVGLVIGSAAFYGSFVKQGFDVGSTIQSAYICQLPISFLYITLVLKQRSLEGWSMWAAWSRTIGTGLIGIFAFLRYPDHPFLLTMAVICTGVDFVYIYTFAQRRKELAAGAPMVAAMAA
jgi:paspaline synthase